MIQIVTSNAKQASAGLRESVRKPKEDNMAWLARQTSTPDRVRLLLVGGRSQVAFSIRSAQACVRHDMLPSAWSHALLIGKPAKNPANTPIHEISLEPKGGFGFPPPTNAVQTAKLDSYRDPEQFPNICVLEAAVAYDAVMDAMKRFQMQRAVLDAVDLLTGWLAYVWGTTNGENPLLAGRGVPSAAMLEVLFGAAGFDLTPGLESRASSPEAIWQSAKWWCDYYEKQGVASLTGAYHIGHQY